MEQTDIAKRDEIGNLHDTKLNLISTLSLIDYHFIMHIFFLILSFLSAQSISRVHSNRCKMRRKKTFTVYCHLHEC